MNKSKQLRTEVDKLEEIVKNAVDKFIEENGACDISINVETIFSGATGEFMDVGVKVYVTV